jgi:SAM-dependent methyltransferase
MDVRTLEYPDETFDITVCSEVIEHLEDPFSLFKGVFRILKKDGLAVFTTPNGGFNALTAAVRTIDRFSLGGLRRMRAGGTNDRGTGNPLAGPKHELSEINSGFGHISVMARTEWLNLFKKAGFTAQRSSGTGGMVFGSPEIDAHRIFFALTMIGDTVLERLPCSHAWSETLYFEMRKPFTYEKHT